MRGTFWKFAVVAGSIGMMGCAKNIGVLDDPASKTVTTKSAQQAMTPDTVLADLKAGNKRFVAGQSTQQDWLAQAATTAREGQFPKAIVLGCLDSRVPPEVVFDQAIGDIFVGRVAGNFENVDLLGSMEFGTKVAGSKLIVVLGHTACGAVQGAIAGAELGNLTATLDNIEPAIAATAGDKSDAGYENRVIIENVRQTVRDIQSRSPVLTELVESGQLKVVGAWYDLATGKVHWLDS